MNVFNNLSQENQHDDEEIKSKNQLRNCKKRLRKLEAKDISDPIISEENKRNIHILRVKIEEYENKDKGVPKKNKKEEEKKKEGYDEDAFLEEQIKNNIFLKKEYDKNEKERQRRLAEEQKEKRRKDEEFRRQREEEDMRYREQEEKNRQKKEEQYRWQRENWEKRYLTSNGESKEKFFAKFTKDDGSRPQIPKSFFDLYDNYNHKKFRELSLKYHGDKPEGCYTLQRILNCIKDLRN